MSKPWKRLSPWLPGGEPPDGGPAALRALADVTEVRRSLDQVELAAVRAARSDGRSWTEIATMLAISRQSAWERWRDLDAVSLPPGRPDPVTRTPPNKDRAARARRRGTVTVPDVVGLTTPDALVILTRVGLDAVSATPGTELQEPPGELGPTVVVRQYPDPDVKVPATSTVRLWLERGDGEAGVREPRRPAPPPRTARGERDERTQEAIG